MGQQTPSASEAALKSNLYVVSSECVIQEEGEIIVKTASKGKGKGTFFWNRFSSVLPEDRYNTPILSTFSSASSSRSKHGWRKSKFNALKQKPLWVLLALLKLCVMIGFGVWGVCAAAERVANNNKDDAYMLAESKAMDVRNILLGAYNPTSTIASMVQQNPFDLETLEAIFTKVAPSILALEMSRSIFNIQLVPNGIIKHVIPITGFVAGPGLDLMRLSSRRPGAMKAIESRTIYMSGPDMLSVGIKAFVGLYPVFVHNVSLDEDFSLPDVKGVPNALNPHNNGSDWDYNSTFSRGGGMGIYDPYSGNCSVDLCYIPSTDGSLGSKFWGFGKAVVGWELVKNTSGLYGLCDTYDFIMTYNNPTNGSVSPIAMCSDERMILTKTPDVLNGTLGSKTLEDYLPRDPVTVTISALQNEWSLHVVAKSGDWTPSWKIPLIAVTVVVSLLLTAMVLLLMAGHLEQMALLSEHKRARQALEAEKHHLDVLVARQLNLISVLASTGEGSTVITNTHASMEVDTLNRIEQVRRQLDKQGAQDDIEFKELLGEGSFGKVFKATWNGTDVAVKTIMLPHGMSGVTRREKMVIMEAAISTSMAHPNVVQTFTYKIRPVDPHEFKTECASHLFELQKVCSTEDRISVQQTSPKVDNHITGVSYEVRLVLEFCDLGCLREALDADMYLQETFNYKAVLDTCSDIAKAMLHLHKANVLHSDLKSRNIMLKSCAQDPRGVVAKVADFGLSVSLDENQTHVSSMFQGTMTHMAPEVMLKGTISKAVDVYAFGITMWELFTGGRPFQDMPKAHLGHAITVGKVRPKFGLIAPREYVQLAEACWHDAPELRPSFSEVLHRLQALRAQEGGVTQNLHMRDTLDWARKNLSRSASKLLPLPLLVPVPVAEGVQSSNHSSGSSESRNSNCGSNPGCGLSRASGSGCSIGSRGLGTSQAGILIDIQPLDSVPEGRESLEKEAGF